MTLQRHMSTARLARQHKPTSCASDAAALFYTLEDVMHVKSLCTSVDASKETQVPSPQPTQLLMQASSDSCSVAGQQAIITKQYMRTPAI